MDEAEPPRGDPSDHGQPPPPGAAPVKRRRGRPPPGPKDIAQGSGEDEGDGEDDEEWPLSSGEAAPAPTPLPAPAVPAPEWAGVIERVKSAIVAIRVTGVRPFEDSPAGVWQGTGFVVSLEDPEKALVLTNRHIISTGPIRAFATFDEHEELPVFPVYRDPVHDFGLLQFDARRLRFTPRREIALSPQGLRVGAEVLVIGNDNSEKIQILPATIARVDRNSPEYDDTNYQDENTFYAGAGSNTSGGSSGSPVIDRSGACIALNAGGASEAASAYYLPLDRVVYVLDWLRENKDKAPLPPRGTILTKFLFQPFDMLRRLGFTEEQERRVLEESVARTAAAKDGGSTPEKALSPDGGRPKGMLVVDSFLPGTQAESLLRPGDVLLQVDGEACLVFASLEARLDARVGENMVLRISRAGAELEVTMEVVDLHRLIPHDFAECAGGVFHQITYHTCKRFHIPVQERGVFVVQSGFGFGLELPYHAVVAAVAGQPLKSLDDFQVALAGVPDGDTFEVSWYNPTTNERRTKRSSVRMERTLWPLCTWRFSAERPNIWRREAAPPPPQRVASSDSPSGGPDIDGTAAPSSSNAGGSGAAAAEAAECAPAGGEARAAEDAVEVEADGLGQEQGLEDQEPLGYPPSRDPTIARVQAMLCTVSSRVAHEYATDFIQSEDERNSTLIRRFGVGLIVDVERGLVITDRYTVPQPLAQVELTFAQIVTTDATCLFVHPQHNLVVLRYDVAAVRPLPVRAVDLQVGLVDESKGGDGPPTVEELAIGEVLTFVSLHGDHRISAKQVTVGSVYLKAWAFAEPPAYRERNLEICNLNDTLQGLGGVLVEQGATGRTRAWFAQFPAGKKHYVAGIPVPVLVGLLRPLGLLAGADAFPALHLAQVPALDCEFEELSLAKARRYHGMSLESTRELAASCCDGRRQVMMVSRVTSGGAFDGRLAEGDVVLRVAGQAVTRPQEVERLMERHSSGNCEAVMWRVLRSRKQVDAAVQPSMRCTDGTSRLVVFNGIVLRPTPRAVAERGGPVRPHTRPGEGLYFWHIFPGSPADTFGLSAPGWLVQVDEEPTPSIDRLLEVIHSGKLRGREWLRCRTMDSEGRPTVRALQPDPLFWVTVELSRSAEGTTGAVKPRWTRTEHSDE